MFKFRVTSSRRRISTLIIPRNNRLRIIQPPSQLCITAGLATGSSCPQTPVFIPEKHQFRTLVLCFDGTGDEFDEDARFLDLIL
jgi:hypothetical protein